METKKNPSKDLEKKKLMFFQIGLIISLSFVFIAFEWKSYYNPSIEPKGGISIVEDPFVIVLPDVLHPTKPKPKPVTLDQIVEVPDDKLISAETVIDEPVTEPIIDLETPPDIIYDSSVPVEPFVSVEEMPEFPGGEDAMYNFLRRNLKYPENLKREKKEGTVFVRFVIETDGSVRIDQYTGGDKEFQKEALRVIKLMPKWKPGKQRTVPVAVYQTLPIFFNFK